ncbi:MAG: stage II sporulation protein P, partial [Clostridiaceae bacterium]|nr:stage II sporulation protein P [Clostridiaceae bacterium]
KSVPITHSRIIPKIDYEFSITKLLFGFDIDKPYTIITNQIALVSAAEKCRPAFCKTQIEQSQSSQATLTSENENAGETTEQFEAITSSISVADINIRNQTSYAIDVQKLIDEKPSFCIDNKQPQVLVFHTHTSEAYAPDEKNNYSPTDPGRTEDEKFNVVRVGDIITEKLNKAGIKTLHDKTLHDYPSYSGSYKKSLDTVQRNLKEHPSIKVVLDIHRDAVITKDGTSLEVSATINDKKTAQVMIVCGSDGNDLEHPNWRENLKFAILLQAKMNTLYPGLARPLLLVNERYNMHTSTGALLLEIGSSGNKLNEALRAGEYCADSIAKVLLER